jgi:uncharacterized lipoprotein YbaY
MDNSLVCGTIVFESAPPDLSDATIHVRLADTSLADAPSRTISERVLTIPDEGAVTDGIPFQLNDHRPNPSRQYSVSVHIDVDSSGTLNRGDYITTENYPVLTFGRPEYVTIRIQRIE